MSRAIETTRRPSVITKDLVLDDVRDLWLGMLRQGWKSLVLVPAAPGAGTSTAQLGRALSDLGAIYRGRAVPVLSAADLTLESVSRFIETMTRMARSQNGDDGDQRILVTLESVITNPLGIAIALAADAVLLVIELGKTEERAARRTVEMIGSDSFIGSVAVK